jgi:mannose/fructose/N-acetylgalactosamine-specific phosphotransferase system component IID
MPDKNRINIVSLVLRSYFIRLFYNYSNMFGEGLCYCLRHLHPKSGASNDQEILKERLDFFNTNEYLSGFAIGIVINSETNSGAAETEKIKTIISSVLGSRGDELINSHIVPVLVLTALNKFAVNSFKLDNCLFWLIIFEIAAFNIFNFGIRYYGIRSGLEKGVQCLNIFKSPSYKNILIILRGFRDILTIFLIINLLNQLFF